VEKSQEEKIAFWKERNNKPVDNYKRRLFGATSYKPMTVGSLRKIG